MSNKFNAHALTEYSKHYARRVTADFYQQHTVITGPELLNVTPVAQVNLFVVNALFDRWRADAEKFRSPYFDFTNPEVREALTSFMNVVSGHIAVRREHLEPLLADATRKAITLIFDPRAYFDELLRGQPEFTLTADALKQITRFTQINKFIPLHLTNRMNGKPFVYVNQALIFLDEAFVQRGHELERHDQYVAQFSEKVPMDVAALLRSHVPDAIPAPPTRSFFDTATESSVPPAPLVSQAGEPVSPPVAPVTEGVTDDNGSGGPLFLGNDRDGGPEPVAPVSQPSQMPAGAFSEPTVTDATPGPSSADGETGTVPTLNDRLRASLRAETPTGPAAAPSAKPTEAGSAEPMTVAQTFARAPVESVARSISLNQKFRFINQLFNGNAAAYNQAIDELDQMDNYGQALDLISYRYASQYLWDMSSDEVSELVEILKRRFA